MPSLPCAADQAIPGGWFGHNLGISSAALWYLSMLYMLYMVGGSATACGLETVHPSPLSVANLFVRSSLVGVRERFSFPGGHGVPREHGGALPLQVR